MRFTTLSLKIIKQVTFFCLSIVLFKSTLRAQVVNTPDEQQSQAQASLQYSGKILDEKIHETYKNMEIYGYLTELAKQDLINSIKGYQDPFNFSYDTRKIKNVPLQNMVNYTKENENRLFQPFGNPKTIKKYIELQIAKAHAFKLNVNPFQTGKKDGLQLTYVRFLYPTDQDKRDSAGSEIISLSLFFSHTTPSVSNYKLETVTLRTVYENTHKGIKKTELVIDSNPQDEATNDIVVITRDNNIKSKVKLLGMYDNNPIHDYRNQFKVKYFNLIHQQFFPVIQRVAIAN